MNTRLLQFGAILGFCGVAIGAFGAHALKDILTPAMRSIYETGVLYQFVHVMAILFSSIATGEDPATHNPIRKRAYIAGNLFAIGIVFFSGSLYVLALTGEKWWGAVTPIGGLCFLAGWIMLAISTSRSSPKSTT